MLDFGVLSLTTIKERKLLLIYNSYYRFPFIGLFDRGYIHLKVNFSQGKAKGGLSPYPLQMEILHSHRIGLSNF